MAELPCGRTANVCTADGALEWLQYYTIPNPCCRIVQEIRRIMTQVQQQPEQQGTTPNEALMSNIAILGALPCALAETHSHKISLKEIQDVVALYTHVLEHLAASNEWKQTGVVHDLFHRELVESIIPWSRMPLFVKAMMPNGFAALAKLMQAPVGDIFPYPWTCETVLMLIHNTTIAVEKLTLQKAKALGMESLLDGNFLYRLEPTGLVAQALRAITSPASNPLIFSTEKSMTFVNLLIRDTKFIWKRCRPGKPLSDTLKALLDGTDGWKPHGGGGNPENPDLPLVQRRLQILYDMSLLDKTSLDAGFVSCCQKCNNNSSPLQKCGHCKSAMYCSRCVYVIYIYCVAWTCIHASFSSSFS
jgi:hypothetical protein